MAEEENNAPETPRKKSKAKLLIILGIVLILAVAGGFFAYNTLMAPSKKSDITPQEEINPVGEMVTFGEFVVNLADPTGKRYLKCKISVEVADIETKERVQKLEPKLRDIVIMLLTSLAFEEVMTPEGKLRIRDELLERFNQAVRPDRIKNLYFSEFVVQ
ncbi:MAG: flagellar basal body protein FliL [Desulfobulbaceae bacterium]|nr:MAG: flagellar basal body protein FliL [Desulfobulbaceae bacterium]